MPLWLTALLFAASPCLAAEPASMPPPGYNPDLASDEAGLWMQVDKAENEIKTSPTLIRDKALNDYVGGLVCRLAGDHCPSIRVYITEVPAFNAYSLPNGAVVVWSGLLLRTDNEAQLAFVLGHEITHYLHRHSLEQFERVVNASGAMLFVQLATAGAGIGYLNRAIQAGAIGALYAHSRDQERDADDGGFKAATANGYDPRQSAMIWRSMAAETNANPHRDTFFASHPQPEERLATMDKQAASLATTRDRWTVETDAYRKAVAPFLAQWVDDELAQAEPNQRVVLFERLAQREAGNGLFLFALGESYRKRNAPGDPARALDAYRAALACASPPPQAWRGIGLLAMKKGDKGGARDAFEQYRLTAPDADDKAMIDFYLTQL